MQGNTQPHTLLYCTLEEGVACILPSIVEGRVVCNPTPTPHPPLLDCIGGIRLPIHRGAEVRSTNKGFKITLHKSLQYCGELYTSDVVSTLGGRCESIIEAY